MIRAIRTEGVQQWVPAVRMAEQHYNHKVHHGTGHAPVELHLGIDPRHPGILAPPGQEAAPLNYADMDEYNKQQAQIAQWVRGKLMIRQAEQAREVARYYQHKNMSLQPGSLVWLHKRATNQLDGDLLVARKLALQWSGPFIYLRTINDCLGEISRQDKGVQTGKPMRVHLSKLRLYRDPEAYPGQHAELFKPGKMGALDDGSTENSKEEDQLLQLPIIELTQEDAAQAPADHFYRMPEAALDIPDEIDQSQPEVPAPVKVQDWLEGQAVIENASRESAQHAGDQGPGDSRREAFRNEL